jgi:hypothetical protein
MKFPDLDGFFKGAAWQERKSYAPLDRPITAIARVMATIEHYVVWRFKGCSPQITHYRNFLERFERTPGFDK